MNASLLFNSVSVYQLLKLSNIPVIALLQLALYNVSISPNVGGSLCLILVGVGMSTIGDLRVNPVGLVYGAAAVFATSLGQVWLQSRPAARVLDGGLRTVAFMSPYAFWVCLAGAFVIDLIPLPLHPHPLSPSALASASASSASSPSPPTSTLASASAAAAAAAAAPILTRPQLLDLFKTTSITDLVTLAGMVALSCLLAVATNYYGFTLIQRTSAITYQVVGHAKTMVTIAAGMVFFPGM
ncbi:hypothetical protein HK102_001549, partial [Quaeritorhiza haematococci]